MLNFGQQDFIDPIVNPPAIVVEAEQAKYQRLVAQGREAAGLEAEGKNANVAWVQALKAAYPDVPLIMHNGKPSPSQMMWHPKVREIIKEVRGTNASAVNQFLKKHKSEKARQIINARAGGDSAHLRLVRRAVVELMTKHKLGADPAECWNRLCQFMEESK